MKITHFVTLGLTLSLLTAAPAVAGWAGEKTGLALQPGVILLAQEGHDRGDRGGDREDRRDGMERQDRGAPAMGAPERSNRQAESQPRMENRAPPTMQQRERRFESSTPRMENRPMPTVQQRERRVESQPRMENRAPQVRPERRVERDVRTQRPVASPRVIESRDRDRQRGYILDQRYHHDRYYPPRGYYARSLPYGYRTYHHHGERYFFYHGIWYQPSGVGFIVVMPPFGMVIPVLPPYYTTVWVGGVPYYYAGGIYYVWYPSMQGYVVSEAPAESSVATQSPSAEQFYVYPKNGQSPEQQSQDRYECHRWAVGQTGFDPSQPASDMTESALVSKRSDYRRAIAACLDARGYSVK